MKSTLFLYVDVLGFSDLVEQKGEVEKLYKVIDSIALHRDQSYRAIVFSDTILAYNRFDSLQGQGKAIELMFLIEFTQDLLRRLVGSGIAFRAIIKEGEFHHEQMMNIEKFYGRTLIDAHRDEKNLIGTGLFLDVALRDFNQIFGYHPFSDRYDFIYLTQRLTVLTLRGSDGERNLSASKAGLIHYPVPGALIDGTDSEFGIYPEIMHLRDIYKNMTSHPVPAVRAKYLATWQMYVEGYPGLTDSFLKHGLQPTGVIDFDWSKAREHHDQESLWGSTFQP